MPAFHRGTSRASAFKAYVHQRAAGGAGRFRLRSACSLLPDNRARARARELALIRLCVRHYARTVSEPRVRAVPSYLPYPLLLPLPLHRFVIVHSFTDTRW